MVGRRIGRGLDCRGRDWPRVGLAGRGIGRGWIAGRGLIAVGLARGGMAAGWIAGRGLAAVGLAGGGIGRGLDCRAWDWPGLHWPERGLTPAVGLPGTGLTGVRLVGQWIRRAAMGSRFHGNDGALMTVRYRMTGMHRIAGLGIDRAMDSRFRGNDGGRRNRRDARYNRAAMDSRFRGNDGGLRDGRDARGMVGRRIVRGWIPRAGLSAVG